jgi:hypothetical protein
MATQIASSQIAGNVVNVFDFMTAAQKADAVAKTLLVDCSSAIIAAISSLTGSVQGGGTITCPPGLNFYLGTANIVIPPNITFDCNNCYMTSAATGGTFAFTLGNSDSVISYNPKLLNLNLKLTTATGRGVRLRGTAYAKVTGMIEGHTADYATRTNHGVYIDGVDASSYFNWIEVLCNHVHIGFITNTTGSVDPTQQFFVNCSSLGDANLGDSTSIGFYFNGNSFGGQGSTIINCNVEHVATGFYAGAGCGEVSVINPRIEMVTTGSHWKFDFVDGCAPWKIINPQGYMESNDGIRNFDSANHMLLGTDDGSMRLAGFDKALDAKKFIGLGGSESYLYFDGSADTAILQDNDNTGTGRIYSQAGSGSDAHGAGYILHAASHAVNPGELHLFPASGAGGVWFKRGIGLATMGGFDRINSLSTNETNLYLYDADNGTLEQVTVGAADSGGSGYKVLRIPN